MSNKLKNDSYFVFKKKIYNIKFFFIKRNKIIADFKDLDSIDFIQKIEIKKKQTGLSYIPKNTEQKVQSEKVNLNDISVYNLRNKSVLLNSNALYSAENNTLYYEKWHNENENAICVYNSQDIICHNQNKVKFRHNVSKIKFEEALFLGCAFPTNYFHFFLEMVSRSAYIESIPNGNKLPLLLSQKVLHIESFKKIIEIFFKDYNVVYLDDNYLYEVQNLWYVTSPNTVLPNIRLGHKFEAKHTKIRAESINYLREKCINFFDSKNTTKETFSKIFIKRKSEVRSYNQEEIEKCASNYGFKSVYFEDLNFEEQIITLQNAAYLVGPTGAAWTNLIFAKSGAKGLIWAGSNWGSSSMFSTIAEIVNFDLNYIIFESRSAIYHEDFNLDVDVFEQNLIKLLNL